MIATWSAIWSTSAIWCDEKKTVIASLRDVRDQRLQHFFGHRRIEPRGRLVEDQQLRAAAEREQQRELGAHAARQRLDLAIRRQLERAEVALSRGRRASADRSAAVKRIISATVIES